MKYRWDPNSSFLTCYSRGKCHLLVFQWGGEQPIEWSLVLSPYSVGPVIAISLSLPCLIFFHSIYTTSMYWYWVGMGIRYRMGFTHSCRRSARLFSSVPWDKSFYGMFLSSVGLSFFCFLFFLVFDMPLTGKCYLLVFPEEGERSANLYRMETGTREERSPTSVSAGVLRMWYCFTRSQSQ